MKPTLWHAALLFAVSAATTTSMAADGSGNDDALRIVDSHAIPFAAPAKLIPSDKMVDGPLLGNGDLGVTIAGNPEALRFHIGKNDFWGQKTQGPQTVGRLELLVPALADAPYRAVCDMRRARWTGDFAKDGIALRVNALVDANANRLFVAAENTGTKPLEFWLRTMKGDGGQAARVPAKLVDGGTALAGCEQHGSGRWFFRGEMADLKVEPQALSDADIAKRARASRGSAQRFDGKTSEKVTVPAIANPFSISGWVKIAEMGEADYILSKGEWNRAYSLGVSGGKLRFSVNGIFVQTETALPKDQWLHVAATYDGKRMAVFVDGACTAAIGGDTKSAGLSFLHAPDGEGDDVRKVALAARILGTDGDRMTLAPGAKATIAVAILSDLDAKNPLTEAKALVSTMSAEKVAECAKAHEAWWETFWKKSYVEIPDKVIEKHWYSAQYILGSCSRAGKVAPGLWGNWITMDQTAWHGDFHLNYNFQAPFYSVFSANRPELAHPFFEAMNQSIPRGKRIAEKRGWKGIHLPVSIGPWGMCPEGDHCDWGQRSNTAYSALLYSWYWRSTRDKEWLEKTGYPYMREVAAFWTDYLKFEDGRYVIHNDAIHEGHSPSDVNPLFSLGAVRSLYRDMLDMSEALGVDAELHAKWRDILAKISGFPTQERNGKTVFRYTEKGTDWWPSNTVGIQHIYPAGAIGLNSDPKLLEISHNMIEAMARWSDYNGSSSWYATCARVGYDPVRTLAFMRKMYDAHAMPNGILYFGGGGIENVSPAAALNEMLMQSHEGVIRLFPAWPKHLDARFGTLRADGAFLVSGAVEKGEVSEVRILSEKGGEIHLQNPWPGKTVSLVRNGKIGEKLSGGRFSISSKPGEKLEFRIK